MFLVGCPQDNNGGGESKVDADSPDVAAPSDTGSPGSLEGYGQCGESVCGPTEDGATCPACALLPTPFGTNCSIEGSPEPPAAMTTEPAFPNLKFAHPVYVTHSRDGTDRLFVVEKQGRIKVFANDPQASAAQVKVFLDITDRVNSGPNEAGLLSVAFHPNYADNGQLFVNYTATATTGGAALVTRVSRFTVSADADLADASSELIVHQVDQPYGNHNGGQVEFGPDGYLYIGHGDGGAGGDPFGFSQNLQSVLGKMLRIDVDNPAAGQEYGIPTDNPYFGANPDAVRPEIFAVGLRNPWRFSFDRLTGTLWAGDVGQDAWEYVHIVENGNNYGWNVVEGNHCFLPKNGCNMEGLELPEIEYGHELGESITGGYVYRGQAQPSLYGAYIYGDYVSGTIWAGRFEEQADGEEAVAVTKLTDSGLSVSSFGEDEAGELYVVHYPYFNPTNGSLHRLVKAPGAPANLDFPVALSQTGCFVDLETMQPATGLFPYDVNAPLWHDGARTERYLLLPTGAHITAAPTGAWEFPDGAKLIKTFVFDTPGAVYRVETRFVIRDGDTIRTYSYQWNPEQTDAFLLSGASETSFELEGKSATWHFPSRSQCKTCHNPGAGLVLGFHTGQLNRAYDYDGVWANQLYALQQLGAAQQIPADPVAWPEPSDESAAVDRRARAALQTNCGTCHTGAGPATTPLDLRYETSLADAAACQVTPEKGDLGVEGAVILAPGEPDKSTLWLRMQRLGDDRMPSLGSFVIDQATVNLVEGWISGLEDCE